MQICYKPKLIQAESKTGITEGSLLITESFMQFRIGYFFWETLSNILHCLWHPIGQHVIPETL